MKKNLVIYFTKFGNNKYIAEKISQILECEMEPIVPKYKNFFLLMLFTLLKISAGIKNFKSNTSNYDRIILVSPIWAGTIVSIVRGFIKNYKDKINDFVFITACASEVEKKDEKFGYEKVFSEIKKFFYPKKISCYAISLSVLFEQPSFIDKQVIYDEVFIGKIKDRFDEIIFELKK